MSTPIQLLPGSLPAGYCWPSFNMLPDASMNDPENSDCTNSELPREFSSAYATLCIKLSDLLHLGWRKFGVSVFNSVAHSKFIRSVFRIVGLGSQKQVLWVHASRIVSIGTIVANAKSIWDWAVVQFPRKPVRGNQLSDSESSVSSTIQASCPKPASFRFLNVGPKSFGGIKKAPSRAIGKSRLKNKPLVPFELFSANTAIGFHCGMLAKPEGYRNN